MHCEYKVTYEDFIHSIKAYRKVSGAALFVYYLRVWMFPLLATLSLLFTIYGFFFFSQDTLATLVGANGGLLLLAILVPISYRIELKRNYKLRTSLAVDATVSLDFNDQTICFTIPSRTEVSYPWTSFTDYSEDSIVGTLFVGKAAFHTIPKRAMDEAGWSELRQYVLPHVRQF